MKKQLIVSVSIILFLLLGTGFVIVYGKGYRFGFNDGKPDISGTGLLVATSNPDGAQVFINGHLTTATNNTLNLFPGTYSVKIFKEGYFPWEKKIKIQQEVVAKAEALLFPTAPKLESISASGVENPTLDPSQTRIAYVVSSQTVRKNGVYVLDMSTRPVLTLQSSSTQIANDTIDSFSKAILTWSPDGKELVATIAGSLHNPTTYLLSGAGINDNPQDVTETLAQVQNTWEKDAAEKERARMNTLKPLLQKFLTANSSIISWSPDETKILYEATQSSTFPLIITPRLVGIDATPEERSLKQGSIYVYDTKEDKNFFITGQAGSLSWLPDGKHLTFLHDKRIDVLEFDGTNQTTIYAGPFIDSFVFPWPSMTKIVILTNLGNPNILPNLYTVGIK